MQELLCSRPFLTTLNGAFDFSFSLDIGASSAGPSLFKIKVASALCPTTAEPCPSLLPVKVNYQNITGYCRPSKKTHICLKSVKFVPSSTDMGVEN